MDDEICRPEAVSSVVRDMKSFKHPPKKKVITNPNVLDLSHGKGTRKRKGKKKR